MKVRRIALDGASVHWMTYVKQHPNKLEFRRWIKLEDTQHVTFIQDNDDTGLGRLPTADSIRMTAKTCFLFWHVIDPVLPCLKSIRIRVAKNQAFFMAPVSLPKPMQIETFAIDAHHIQIAHNTTLPYHTDASATAKAFYDEMAKTLVEVQTVNGGDEGCIVTSDPNRKFPVLQKLYLRMNSDNPNITPCQRRMPNLEDFHIEPPLGFAYAFEARYLKYKKGLI